jgi:hypothetical protein
MPSWAQTIGADGADSLLPGPRSGRVQPARRLHPSALAPFIGACDAQEEAVVAVDFCAGTEWQVLSWPVPRRPRLDRLSAIALRAEHHVARIERQARIIPELEHGSGPTLRKGVKKTVADGAGLGKSVRQHMTFGFGGAQPHTRAISARRGRSRTVPHPAPHSVRFETAFAGESCGLNACHHTPIASLIRAAMNGKSRSR